MERCEESGAIGTDGERSTHGARRWTALSALLLSGILAACANPVRAQGGSDNRQRAADAYDRGVSAYLLRDYAQAARWFDQAHRLAPSPIALGQAVRAYKLARDVRRSGSLGLRLLQQEGLTPQLAEVGRSAVADAQAEFVRVDVECTAGCSLAVDGQAQDGMHFFVPAGRDVTVTATFGPGQTQDRTVHGQAGSVVQVLFAPAEAMTPTPEADAPETPAEDPRDLEASLGEGENPYRISKYRFFSRPRATFFGVLAPTLISIGMVTWSGVDARHSRQDLHDAESTGDPTTIAVAQNNHDRDVRRTKWFSVQAGAFLFATALVAAFTDWTPHGDGTGRTRAEVEVSPRGASVGLVHSF